MGNIWNWYISLFSDQDNKIVIAAWGVTITTIGFIFNTLLKPIYVYFQQSKQNISIKAYHTRCAGGIIYQSIDVELIITNQSKGNIYIYDPIFKIGKSEIILKDNHNKYPLLLLSRQQIQFNHTFDMVFIMQYLSLGNSFRYVIIDTLKNRHVSKKYKRNQIIDTGLNKFKFWEK